MPVVHSNIIALVDYVKIDSFNVEFHFRCRETDKSVVSAVAFEPFEGKIEFTWQELLLHPIKSYNRYYHTPIRIYSRDIDETIALKAFKKVADKFRWNSEKNSYIYI